MIDEIALFKVLDAWMQGDQLVSKAYKATCEGLDPLTLRNQTLSDCTKILNDWEKANEKI